MKPGTWPDLQIDFTCTESKVQKLKPLKIQESHVLHLLHLLPPHTHTHIYLYIYIILTISCVTLQPWSPRSPPHSPGVGTVAVERLEVLPGDELAPVHPGLDGPEPPQHPDLLHVAHHRGNVQALELGVDGVEPADQVLEEHVERLGQADELRVLHRERGQLGTFHLHQFTLVVLRRALHGRRGGVHGLGAAGHRGSAGFERGAVRQQEVRAELVQQRRVRQRRSRGGRGGGSGGRRGVGGRGDGARRRVVPERSRGEQSLSSRGCHSGHVR